MRSNEQKMRMVESELNEERRRAEREIEKYKDDVRRAEDDREKKLTD